MTNVDLSRGFGKDVPNIESEVILNETPARPARDLVRRRHEDRQFMTSAIDDRLRLHGPRFNVGIDVQTPDVAVVEVGPGVGDAGREGVVSVCSKDVEFEELLERQMRVRRTGPAAHRIARRD